MSPDLAKGWEWAEVADLLKEGPTNGYSPPSDTDGSGPLTLKLTATTSGQIRLDAAATKRVQAEIPSESRFWLRPGDLLVQRANTLEYVGTAAVYRGPLQTFIYPDLMMRLRPKPGIEVDYLWRFFNSPAGKAYFRSRATGTAGNMPKINGATLKRMRVPVPPENEQRRIVAKLDALMAKSRRAKDALDAIPPLLDKLRQSILAAAFRGDLTADWRAAHPDVEPASELLQRIRAERRRRWEEAELAKLKAKGKTPTDDRWKAKYQEPEPVDESGLPELPEGWCWASAEILAQKSIIYGIIKAGPDYPGGVPYVRVTEVASGRIVVDELPRCDPARAAMFERSVLSAGDILVSKDGTIGKVAFVPPELEGGNINQHVLRVSSSPLVNRFFLARMVEAPSSQRWMTGEVRGVALQGVNVEDFRRLPIPLPSRSEQEAIQLATDQALTHVDATSALIRSSQSRLERLDSAALAKAFRGELVPQDPIDEPASVLLERIRSESGVQTKTRGRRARSKTA